MGTPSGRISSARTESSLARDGQGSPRRDIREKSLGVNDDAAEVARGDLDAEVFGEGTDEDAGVPAAEARAEDERFLEGLPSEVALAEAARLRDVEIPGVW